MRILRCDPEIGGASAPISCLKVRLIRANFQTDLSFPGAIFCTALTVYNELKAGSISFQNAVLADLAEDPCDLCLEPFNLGKVFAPHLLVGQHVVQLRVDFRRDGADAVQQLVAEGQPDSRRRVDVDDVLSGRFPALSFSVKGKSCL